MASGPVRFFFDFLSPYAYLAWKRAPGMARAAGRELEPVPILLASLLDAHGQLGPAEVPAKRAYVMVDVARKADALGGIVVRPPPAHPFNPLLALRVASLPELDAVRHAVIDALFDAVWAGGPGVEDPQAVARLVTEAGADGARAVAAAAEPPAKARLREASERALGEGVFGVPTMLVDGAMFWGVDSLPHLERFLAGHDPVDRALLARWADLPATARRRVPAGK